MKHIHLLGTVFGTQYGEQINHIYNSITHIKESNWRAPWKNRICSTTMKQKITRRASDVAENLQLYITSCSVFRSRSSCKTHLMLFSEHPPIHALCTTISGRRTEQHVIIAGLLPCHWLYEWFSRAEQPNNMLWLQVLESWLQSF